MTGKDKFFFEEDPEAEADSGISWQEHSDTFSGLLEDIGVLQERTPDSLKPAEVESLQNTKHVQSHLVDIEYGTVNEDYVIHVTPIHPKFNLGVTALYNEALKTCVVDLNKLIPQTLTVDIYHPQPDWEIKAMSFVVRGGAVAWNLDQVQLESCVLGLVDKVGKICSRNV